MINCPRPSLSQFPSGPFQLLASDRLCTFSLGDALHQWAFYRIERITFCRCRTFSLDLSAWTIKAQHVLELAWSMTQPSIMLTGSQTHCLRDTDVKVSLSLKSPPLRSMSCYTQKGYYTAITQTLHMTYCMYCGSLMTTRRCSKDVFNSRPHVSVWAGHTLLTQTLHVRLECECVVLIGQKKM